MCKGGGFTKLSLCIKHHSSDLQRTKKVHRGIEKQRNPKPASTGDRKSESFGLILQWIGDLANPEKKMLKIEEVVGISQGHPMSKSKHLGFILHSAGSC